MKSWSAFLLSFFLYGFIFFIESKAAAEHFYIENIVIKGNIRIERETIFSQSELKTQQSYTHEELDQALKNLYSTGFFSDASLKLEGSTLIIQVKENPIVNQVEFEGNDKLSDDILKTEIQLRPRQTYTLARLRADTQRIQDLYRLKGHFAAVVTPEIIKRDQNRVDVIFNIKEGSPTVVQQIFFIGNKKFDHSKLESVIQTKETRWYRFFTSDDNYDPNRLAYDRELLRKFYLEHGYADFQVKSAVAELTPDQKEFFITFTLYEGERYKIGKVNLKSSLKKIDLGKLRQVITLNPDEWYSSKEVERSISALTDTLGNMGYAFVDVQPNIEKDKNKKTLDLTFSIQEGPRVYINKIDIFQNDRTDEEVIRREMRFYEGDAFNTNLLKDSEKRIKDLGFFKKVTVNKKPGNAPDLIDLNVQVEEDRTGELSLGAGFSTMDGPLIDAKFAEHNFRGKGQDLRAGVTLAKKRQEYDIGFTEPYFLNRELSAGFDLYRVTRTRFQDASFDQQINGLSLHLGYQLSDYLSQVLGYRIQTDNVNHIRQNASQYVREQAGNKLLSAISQEIAYDRRDSKVDPTMGYIIGFGNDLAGLGGNISFLKNQIKGAYYYPIGDSIVLEVKGRYGIMFGLGRKTRIADRYVLGGDTLRGFEPGGVGPHDIKTNDPLGGQQFYAFGAEATFPIGLPNEFGVKGALFSDAGSVWQSKVKGPTVVDKPSLRVSVGGGLRWKSPMGPIKVDFGQAVLKEKGDRTQLVLFGFTSRF